jgi:hypothetical protein
VLRNTVSWQSDDGAGIEADYPLGDLEWCGGAKGKRRQSMNYSRAARAALWRASTEAAAAGRTEFNTDDLMTALLAETNRAVELLENCGIDRDELLRHLSSGSPVTGPDSLDQNLRRTRDFLLGRISYQASGPSGWLADRFLRLLDVNYATAPAAWITVECGDQARRLGHRPPDTAHILLALLATHEVAQRYPHLVDDDRLYAGARVLAQYGITYRAAREVATQTWGRPGRDTKSARTYLRRRRDTTAIILAILDGDTSAARTLAALGVAPEELRHRLLAT